MDQMAFYAEYCLTKQLGRSPKVVAVFSATNFSSYIIDLLKLHDTIKLNEIMHESIII